MAQAQGSGILEVRPSLRGASPTSNSLVKRGCELWKHTKLAGAPSGLHTPPLGVELMLRRRRLRRVATRLRLCQRGGDAPGASPACRS